MIKIDVVDYNSKKANRDFRFKGTYLHGVLEREIGYDIFCFDREVDFPLGATQLIIKSTGKRATFFLWKADGHRNRGFVGYLVYDNDVDYDFCRKNFELQKQNI
tara:strand:+ start:136 stop:447 length:312 start_codon:yes stop_codon:yes gene_type:complete